MAVPISTNVIKISQDGIQTPVNTLELNYPKTCDYCRNTYNSELTFRRHKQNGKCFRFCRLHEGISDQKPRKPLMYPRSCENCSKVYKNKHTYYKHKLRCFVKQSQFSDLPETPNPSTSQNIDLDITALCKDDIENIPIAESKDNAIDFDSKFILTLDVDEQFEISNSLYPRICEFCHKIFNCKETFFMHRISGKCSKSNTKKNLPRNYAVTHKCEKCQKVFKLKTHYVIHSRKCGRIQAISSSKRINSQSNNANKLVNVDPAVSEVATSSKPMSSDISTGSQKSEISYPKTCPRCNKECHTKETYVQHFNICHSKKLRKDSSKMKTIYPRTCTFCDRVFALKYAFYRHKKKCFGYICGPGNDSKERQCEDCTLIFEDEISYKEHMTKNHPSVLSTEPRWNLYPRKCNQCGNTYLSRQTYCNHKKRCYRYKLFDDDTLNNSECDKVQYPRRCTFCNHLYANRQSFCNHKKWCKSITFDPNNSENKLYPRECKHCKETFSNEQSYYQHKISCETPEDEESQCSYPRACKFCTNVYEDLQSYYDHKKTCPGYLEKLLKEESKNNDYCVDFTENNYRQFQNSPSLRSNNVIAYPRMCAYCRKIYASRQTFYKHKQHCVPVPPLEYIMDEDPVSEEEHVYPRECTTCLGTFQSAETFNAHKIKCDFFNTQVDDSCVKIITSSKCEHCRNILTQYRRIFHEHLKQCTDPLINSYDQFLSSGIEPTAVNSQFFGSKSDLAISSRDGVVNGTDNFCECCGVFYATADQLEAHKRSIEPTTILCNVDVVVADENPNICDLCSREFETKEACQKHKGLCIVSSTGKTYPRFCECCKKIYKNKQTFYNHKKNCHIYCLKYFIQKECESCLLPFKCEQAYLQHTKTCVRYDNGEVAAECEVFAG